jgi:hypothetical protein
MMPGRGLAVRSVDNERVSLSRVFTSDDFTIFEGTTNIQRIIGRSIIGLDVR